MKPILLAAVAAVVVAPIIADESGTRPLSLQDCIQMALQKNLDIRVAKVDPMIQFSLSEQAYGGYDPKLGLGASQRSFTRPSQYDPNSQNNTIADTTLTTDYNGSVGGLLPTGLTYNVSGDFAKSSSEKNPYPYGSQSSISLAQPLLKN
ncbi:MAG TPA: hypothetical protein VMF06_08460, partial [Candidatus Limnocylindria bacterium]|nr:hypothetical protein [Candidatus Limnocylindria bacterium]